MRLGLVGFGAIGSALVARMASDVDAPPRFAAVLSPRGMGRIGIDGPPPGLDAVFDDARALLEWSPDLVIECANHAGVREHVPHCLEHGVDVVLVSVGALADADLAARLENAARGGGAPDEGSRGGERPGGARIILPAGAIGGLDLLGALAVEGLESVRYRGVKPPEAWRGSPAEELLDLADLDGPTTFFEGDARGAAREYPKNANVTATLALHGLGFERTAVTLVADPGAAGNTHEIDVRAACGDFSLRVSSRPSEGNARTSATTVLSVIHEIGRWRVASGEK